MQKEPLKTLWLGVMLGLLIVTAPNWVNRPSIHTYDAPWCLMETK
jgi:hypothetical protein